MLSFLDAHFKRQAFKHQIRRIKLQSVPTPDEFLAACVEEALLIVDAYYGITGQLMPESSLHIALSGKIWYSRLDRDQIIRLYKSVRGMWEVIQLTRKHFPGEYAEVLPVVVQLKKLDTLRRVFRDYAAAAVAFEMRKRRCQPLGLARLQNAA